MGCAGRARAAETLNEVREMHEEMVILVDEHDRPTGTAAKSVVHHGATPLHRGFSCFVFNTGGELLLQQRAFSKTTWPGIWSNSVCGHPAPDEDPATAVHRRLDHELGMTDVEITLALPDYRYRAELRGVVENEFCPVWIGVTRSKPRPNPDEVAAVRWVPWSSFLEDVRSSVTAFSRGLSPWSREETLLLAESVVLRRALGASGA